MTAQSLFRRLLAAFVGITLVTGCFSTDHPGDKPSKVGGWDEFPNKALPDLKELSTKVTKLPLPMGTLYNQGISGIKTAASDPCPDGPREIFGLSLPNRGLYLVDTIRYYDSAGRASCQWQPGATVRQTHNRHIIDLNSGEAWETIVDSVFEGDVMPSHRISGKGRIVHASGLEFEIKSYGVNILVPPGEPNAIISDFHLNLYWGKGYHIELGMANPNPFLAPDFFPVRAPGNSDIVMTGRIRHDTITVGYLDLTSDHSVRVRDWKGNPLTISPNQ